VIAHIATMPSHTPVYRTLDTIHAWGLLMGATVTALRQLVNSATFRLLTNAEMTRIAEWVYHRAVSALWQGPVRIVHADLSTTNILHTSAQAQTHVIDMKMIEQAMRLPPSIPSMTDALCILLEITWLTEAATRWFPAGASYYDK
jgi:hypothetical protein